MPLSLVCGTEWDIPSGSFLGCVLTAPHWALGSTLSGTAQRSRQARAWEEDLVYAGSGKRVRVTGTGFCESYLATGCAC